jgi:hypothetical protein
MARLAGLAACAAVGAMIAGTARADEVYVGGYAHDVSSFISSQGIERGEDIEVGYRSAPLDALAGIGRPMVYGSFFANNARRTSYGSVGFLWRAEWLHERLYGQVGLGAALHDQATEHQDPFAPGLTPAQVNERLYVEQNFKALGARVLFNPSLSFGVRLSRRWALEGVWTHISNAGLGKTNPGMDDFGGRLVFRFGPLRR